MINFKATGVLTIVLLGMMFPGKADDAVTVGTEAATGVDHPKADGRSENTSGADGSPIASSGTHSFSFFSIFKSDSPLKSAVDDLEILMPDVVSFYQMMSYEPAWFVDGKLTKNGQIALEVLQSADEEGLDPREYDDAIQILKQPDHWIDAEILLTQRFLEFIGDVRSGRIDAMKISPDIKFHSPKAHAVELLVDALQDKKEGGNKLRRMAPHLPQYAELKKILAEYRARAHEAIAWPTLTGTETLKVGDTDPDVIALRQILVLHGVLSEEQATSEKFDTELATALRQFQKRYSLEPDGAVGSKTKEALNYSLKDRIQQVIVNMERLRWLPDDLGDKHIIVNVAGYVLHGFEKSQSTLMMPVIVGRPDRRTPLFYATLKNIILNPSWGVPHSIFMHDKLPKIRHDPGYVKRGNFTVMDRNGRVIDPDAADWANEGRGYYLRQSPGRHNALGQIKFNIENPYTIYMHGTPQQNLFSKNARALSSGCIRLKHPLKLAAWVLNNDPKWSCDTIQAAIDKGETQTVSPGEYVPVYFTYETIWVKENEKGKRIFFSNDPYHLDARMIKMLNLNAPKK